MGRYEFDVLEKMFADKSLIDTSFLSKHAEGKLIITCGYNGRRMQQHLVILEAIDKLPDNLKQRIFLFLPMTYKLAEEHYNEVYEKLEDMGIPYQIQKERLSLEQNLTMRMKTNIVVNIQKTDALSGSLQEHLYCSNVLIVGDWLPYEILSENGVFFIKTSLDTLSINIKEAIIHYDKYKKKCNNNRTNLYNLTSWKAILPQWKTMYEELIQN